MSREVVHTEKAPAAVGPYSQGIIANGFIFTAGQGGLVPGTKTPVEGGIQAANPPDLREPQGDFGSRRIEPR